MLFAKTQRSLTILIVEDDALLRKLLATVLAKDGYRVLLAGDGRDAIGLFRQEPEVSLVLLDWTMPGMNGDRVYDELLCIRDGVPVIVMSGSPQGDVLQAFDGRPVSSFIQKPFLSRVLCDTIRTALAAGNGRLDGEAT